MEQQNNMDERNPQAPQEEIQEQPLQAQSLQAQPISQPPQAQPIPQPLQAQPISQPPQAQPISQPIPPQPYGQPYGQPMPQQPYGQPMPQPYGQPQQQVFVQNVVQTPPKSRVAYILLAFFLGGIGVHNFYAGYVGKGVAQLLLNWFVFWPLGIGLSFLILPLALLFVIPIWNIIEMIVVDRDASGQPMV